MTIERRSKMRYPLELNVRYQTLETRAASAGAGQTVNMSSNGLLVACHAAPDEGTRLRLTVEWPSLLNGSTPLQLVTVGSVVRATDSNFAVAFENYQFRTMGRTARQPDAILETRPLPKVAMGGAGALPPAMDSRPASPYGRGLTRSLSLVKLKS
ncbi:MAG TPA: PilZ domain-containing protein [Bryobacteraceae bacterium]|nr:PilZ domain-containing protein [Bryobacteraceae bacterium]